MSYIGWPHTFFYVSVLVSLISATVPSADAAGIGVSTQPSVTEDFSGRPNPESTPTPIRTTIYLLDISHVDDIEQSFTVDFAFRLRWRDPRLIDPKGASGNRKAALEDVWNPQARILNPRDLSKLLPDTVNIDPNGNVTYRQRYVGKLAVALDLHEFPFDDEVFSIIIASSDYSPQQVAFVADEKPSAQADTFSLRGWSIGPGTASAGSLHVPVLDSDLAIYSYDFKGERQLGFYVWKVLAPLCLIVMMSYAVFWIDPTNMGVQVGLSTAAILTLIAFYLHLSNLLPPVPFPTRLDTFVLSSTVLVFFAFGEGIVTCTLAAVGHDAAAVEIDRWMRWMFPLAFSALLLFLLLSASAEGKKGSVTITNHSQMLRCARFVWDAPVWHSR